MASVEHLENICNVLEVSLKDLFDVDYCCYAILDNKLEREIIRLTIFLKSKKADEIRMCYRILKSVFEQIEKKKGR